MQSLYDALQLPNPEAPAQPVEPWPEHLTGKQFAELVVNSLEFRQYILVGVRTGEIPQGVVKQLMDYAWGQPVKRVEVEEKVNPLGSWTPEQLKARASYLLELAKDLQDAHNTPTTDSVH